MKTQTIGEKIKVVFIGRGDKKHNEHLFQFKRFDVDETISLMLGGCQMSSFPSPEPQFNDTCYLSWERLRNCDGWMYAGLTDSTVIPEKKKYTIIYSHVLHPSTLRVTMTKMDKIESSNISETISQEKYNGCVNFIFDGWPTQTGNDKEIKVTA